MPDTLTDAERDLLILLSTLCCSASYRDAVCGKLADYLEVNAYQDDFAKAYTAVDEDGGTILALCRSLVNAMNALRAAGEPQAQIESLALALFANDIRAAHRMRLDRLAP
jgi:hypothetical protein